MPRRNLLLVLLAVVCSHACYIRGEQNPFARYTSFSYLLIDKWALEDVPEDELFAGAVSGMVDVLREHGDDHSTFISKQEASTFQDEMRQQFGGVGVRVRLTGDPPRPTIVGPPEPGTPAFRADVRAGDVILSIDRQPTDGWDMRRLLRAMRGEVGAAIDLELLHENEESPVPITLVREIIEIASILGDLRNADGEWSFAVEHYPELAMVRIIHFGDKTTGELEATLSEVVERGAKGIILDLRDNSGGALDAAVAICDMFLKPGLTIVETRGRDQQVKERFTSSGRWQYQDIPLVVVINQNSASASEIVAACLQDHGRATVVGQRSYGKGTVQRVLEIGSRGDSLLKITSASYWRPSGLRIHRLRNDDDTDLWGVVPDEGFEVALADEEYVRFRKYRSNRDIAGASDTAANSEEEPFVDEALLASAAHLKSVIDPPDADTL